MKFTVCLKGKWEREDGYALGLKKRTEDRDRRKTQGWQRLKFVMQCETRRSLLSVFIILLD